MKKLCHISLFLLIPCILLLASCKRINKVTSVDTAQSQVVKNPALERVNHKDSLIIAVNSQLNLDARHPRDFNLEPSIGSLLTESLYQVDKDSISMRPILATDLPDISDDGRVYRVNLAKNRNFNDGTRLTADDVLFSYQLFLDPSSTLGRPRFIDRIVGAKSYMDGTDINSLAIKVIDQYTIEFTFIYPFSHNIIALTIPIFSKKSHYFRYNNFSSSSLSEPDRLHKAVTTGPYIAVGHEPEDHVLYQKSPYYNGPKDIKIDKIRLKVYKHDRTMRSRQVADLLSGKIDIIASMTKDDYTEKIKNSGYINSFNFLKKGYNELVFNTRKQPFNSEKMRQAISYAIDQDTLMKRLYGDYGYQLAVPVSASWPNFYNDKKLQLDLNPYRFDQKKALSLFSEEGYIYDAYDRTMKKDGQPLELTWITQRNGQLGIFYSIITHNIEAMGIKVNVEKLAVDELQDRIYNYPDSYDFFDANIILGDVVYGSAERYHTKNSQIVGSNFSFFSDSKNDQLIDQLTASTTNERYDHLFAQWLLYINQQQPTLVLFSNMGVFAYNSRLKPFDPGTLTHWWNFIEDYEFIDE